MADNEKIDDFELVNCVATGSVTQIWEVKRTGNPQALAMKLLLDEAVAVAENRQMLKHEATVGKMMHHPNIISIFDVKISKKLTYYTMEYFRSGNLKSMIRNDHALAQARIKSLMEYLSQALGYFHEKGWIHRDIKPDNVLLNKGGEVRLIDFSLSSRPSNAVLRALTKKSSVTIQGTRTYLAPELIRREALTKSADIYSLGVLLYEALIGNPPFRTANPNDLLMMHVKDTPAPPSELDDNIMPDVDKLVRKMMAKKVKDRHANMQEVYAEVRNMKFFKDDPVKVARERAEARALSDAQASEDRVNSRMDATRDRSKDAERPAPKPKPKPILLKHEKKQPAQQPAPQQPPQQVPHWGQMPPGYPMQPGMPMPGYPGMMPGQQMPGYPMQPGMQMPGYPGMMPGQQMPGYPMPGYQQPGAPQQGGNQQMAPQQGGYQQPFPQPGMPQQQPGNQQPFPQSPGQPQAPPQPGGPQQSAPKPAAPQPAAPPQPSAPKPAAPQPAAPTGESPAKKKASTSPQDIPLATFDDLVIE